MHACMHAYIRHTSSIPAYRHTCVQAIACAHMHTELMFVVYACALICVFVCINLPDLPGPPTRELKA